MIHRIFFGGTADSSQTETKASCDHNELPGARTFGLLRSVQKITIFTNNANSPNTQNPRAKLPKHAKYPLQILQILQTKQTSVGTLTLTQL